MNLEYPIKNDPIYMAAVAFQRLYPEIKYEAFYTKGIRDREGQPAFGVTTYAEDGGPHEIAIDLRIFETKGNLANAAEIFAHELAHCVAGHEAGHGKIWEEVFDKIFDEYKLVCDEFSQQYDRL